jgi:folate-binding protein YgfZ
VFLAS